MQFDEEMYSKSNKVPMFPIVLGALSFVVMIGLLVTLANSGQKKRPAGTSQSHENTISAEMNTVSKNDVQNGKEGSSRIVLEETKRKASDLNFWGMYPEEEQAEKKDGMSQSTVVKPKPQQETTETDPSKDGKHVQVVLDDGSTKWLAINNSLNKNNYDVTNYQKENKIMKYYSNKQNISYAGVTLNKYSGDIDFEQLKKQGISFAMIRVGSRGYDSGLISLDENFNTYMTQAIEAGLNVGVYFATQAITPEEAAEEADFMIQSCAAYKVTYPMAVKMDVIKNDSSRTESMSKNDRTTVMRIFMEAIAGANQKPMLLADKNVLLTKLDLAALSGFGIWLDQAGDLPEYPYAYQMWQYGTGADMKGASENVKLNISLIDYAAR